MRNRAGGLALLCGIIIALVGSQASAAEPQKNPTENDYFKIEPVPIPAGINLEAGGLDLMPDGKLAVSTRRGDIYLVSGAHQKDLSKVGFRLFASGLHEVLGVTYRDGWLYATQRCELSRLKDEDGDGRADLFETVNDDWEVSGDYHEYAFGSKFDKRGDQWIVLCLTGSFSSNVKYRGWCLQVHPDGTSTPICSGIRSPGGIGMNAEGDMFYTDNQGPWNGTCWLKHLKPGGFMGHPGGNRWYDENDVVRPRPPEPKSGSRIAVEEKRVPQLVPPAIAFPYNKMGQSASGIATDMSGGKFGPFSKQMFVGDQTHSTVMRVFLEKIDGVYQGVCFPFRSGVGSGTIAMRMSKQGTMFVGGSNRGWGSRGTKPYSLDRISWTGKVPFEVHEMRVKPDGFELTFTKPVDLKTAADLKSYTIKTYTYIYQASYGSPEVDHSTPKIKEAIVAKDGKSVRLVIEGMRLGHVHELKSAGVRSSQGLPLLHDMAYYQLNRVPKK